MSSSPKVYAAISKVMAEIGRIGISKDRKNQQQGYAFRGIDDVFNALNALLAGAGLCILPRVTSREVTERATQKGGVLFYVVLQMEFDLCCAEDGSKHTIAVSGEAMDSADKATNKAMSAAFKYACMQVFCIPTEGNPDADAETHDVAPQEHKDQHDPRGDLGKNIPADQAMATATARRGLLELDVEEKVKMLKIYDKHEVLNKDPDLYVASSKQMTSGERSAWNKYCAMAKEAEKEDRAVSSIGGKRW